MGQQKLAYHIIATEVIADSMGISGAVMPYRFPPNYRAWPFFLHIS
jgi:hypothetical protein